MPIMYVNPAPRGARRPKKVRVVRIASGVKMGTPSRRRKSAAKRKNAASRRATKKKGNTMARKLYGAAAKAHAKRLAKSRRKRNPARKRHTSRKRRTNPAHRKARRHARRRNPDRSKHRISEFDFEDLMHKEAKAKRAAKKAAKTRAANAEKSSKKRKSPKKKGSSAATRRRRRARRSGVSTLRAARRIIRRSPRKIMGRRTAKFVRRYKMHSNPRRRHARRRRNPGLMGTPQMLMGAIKAAVPVAASLYLTRFIIAKVGPSIPMVDKLGVFQGPAVAGLMVVGANFATKKGPLAKYRAGIMLGTSLNLVDTLIKAFAPQGVKSMFGLGDSGIYDQAMGEYATVGDYLQVGDDEPIDDDITLSDYVETSGVEEELGALQEELGVMEELGGGVGPRRLGGVSQGSMLKALKQSSSVGVVPQRSFVKQVPSMGPGYDNPGTLYTGIFGGGW